MESVDEIIGNAFIEYFAKVYIYKFRIAPIKLVSYKVATTRRQVIRKIIIRIDNCVDIIINNGYHCDCIKFIIKDVNIYLDQYFWVPSYYSEIQKHIEKISIEWLKNMINYFADNFDYIFADLTNKDHYTVDEIKAMNTSRRTFMLCNNQTKIFPPDISKIIHLLILF
jgi:hypothetical protein